MTGAMSQTVVTSNTDDLSETGSQNSGGTLDYTQSDVASGDVSTDTEVGNVFTGSYTITHTDSGSLSMVETADGASGVDYTLTHAVTSSESWIEAIRN